MKKILFIEDEKDFSQIIEILLRKENFEVVMALDGNEGLRKVYSERPDLILLDLIMPKMDGFEFLKQLRGADDLPWIPVIVFTSQVSPQVMEDVKKAGGQGFLSKANVDAHMLRDKIEEFLAPE